MSCWSVIELISIALEVAIVALAIYLVWNLQMRFKLKAFVVMAFSVRILYGTFFLPPIKPG